MRTFIPLLATALQVTISSATVPGFDVSHYQGTVNFKGAYSSGARFVLIKATEGTTYQDPKFSDNYVGATNAGFIRGAYHFARPDGGSGSAQAQYFHSHGGGWSKDGITLPGMLDIEYGPTSTCYGLSATAMVNWITDFVNEYHALTTRYPLIYTTNDWWTTCTGNTKKFSTTCPLVLARYSSSVGTIPGGWPFQTIWQSNDHYTYGGDTDTFNGDSAGLKKLATG